MTALLMHPPVAESYRQLDFSWEEQASSCVEPIGNSTIETPLEEIQPEECLQSVGETQAQTGREEQDGILRFREDTETGVKRIEQILFIVLDHRWELHEVSNKQDLHASKRKGIPSDMS